MYSYLVRVFFVENLLVENSLVENLLVEKLLIEHFIVKKFLQLENVASSNKTYASYLKSIHLNTCYNFTSD